MTKEEAINQLQDAKDGYQEYLSAEAIDMAIKALEQESMLEKIREKVDWQEKWLMCAGYNAYNVYIAFNSIRSVVKESEDNSMAKDRIGGVEDGN